MISALLLASTLAWGAKESKPAAPPPPPVPACEKANAKHFVVTDDGWIFNPQDLLTKHHGKPEILARLTELGAAFAAQDVKVVIVLLPQRAMVRPDVVGMGDGNGGLYNRAEALKSYQDLRQKLIKAGYIVPDMMPVAEGLAKKEGFFFSRDHHWTQAGAKAAAQAVAAEAKKLPGFAEWPKATVSITPNGQTHTWSGSRGNAWQELCGQTLPEQVVPLNDVKVTGAAAGLLDGPPPPVVLVGTSNTHPRFDFAGHLVDAMGVDVINAEQGANGGPVASLQRVVSGETWTQSRPKLLVWEFSMSELKPWRPDTPELATMPIYRQLIPAVDGGCDAASALASADITLAPGVVEALKVPADKAIQGKGHYLFLTTNPKGLQGFAATFTHAGGQVDKHTVNAYSRTPSQGRFFIQLDGAPSPLTNVSLEIPTGVSGPATVRLCTAKGG
jgi:alginate biosynthesis protein AlgX